MKKRLIFDQVRRYLDHKNALVITGMRQVGKTTLMRQLYDSLSKVKKIWFDFDNPLDLKNFEDIDYRNIYQRLKREVNLRSSERLHIFIDEIQNFPEITKIIKYLIDHFQVKFVVTGSSSFYLKNLFPESLSGRKFLYELPPLSFKEFLYFREKITRKEALVHDLPKRLKEKNIYLYKKFEPDFNEYLEFGGFPEVVITPESDTKMEVLRNIFASFFEKDLKIISDYKDIRELRDLMILLVPRIGSMIDVTKLATEIGVRRSKIYNYLEFLQGTFMIRLLPKYSKSIDRSIAGGRKIYFTDTGLLRIIGNLNDAQLFENAVVNQLSQYGSLSFYNRRNTAEIDLILDQKIAFEVKLNGTDRAYHKLHKLSQKLGLLNQYIISKSFVKDPPEIIPALLI